MRLRLFIILLLVGLLPINLLKFGVLENYEMSSVEQRAALIRSQCRMIAQQLAETEYISGRSSTLIDTELSQMGNLYSGRVVIVNNNFRIIKDTYGIDEDKIIIAEEVLNCFSGVESKNYNRSEEFLEVIAPVNDDVTKEILGAMIISVPTTDIRQGKEAVSNTVFLLQSVLMLAVLVMAFFCNQDAGKAIWKGYCFSGRGKRKLPG